ncbi:hypothetical protein [Actinokineospora xionganensis]|uniref:Tfp pilus assembly protein PilX n=1 Tax=Actinokineospora xionganensis TaxID=2684470 RepID=A0ABR7KZ07_9PSEU|nr:hypothetical protein [Actinokineospora xionganensis]MBC6445675.1 hypothetical protein [Actinokineospora xionganensis]
MRRRDDDSGAALILVLVLVVVISLGLLSLLTFSGTSIRTTIALRDQGATASTSDGAMAAAINTIRNSTYNNSPGQNCFGGSDTLTLDGIAGAGAATVACGADPSKVLIQCPSLSMCNRPGSAVLTLGTHGGEDGVNIQQPTGSMFRVRGVVFSNSNINVVNGTLATNTRVYGRTGCSGTIISDPSPPSCPYAPANPLGEDPNYLPAVAAAPPHRTLPACTSTGRITFEPGYYDDANALTAMMGNGSACKNSVWWFKPGAYYFDFHNTGPNANPRLPSAGGNIWTIDTGKLVAGTPVNAAGQVIAQPPLNPTIPGSCNNPIKDANAVGVQFIFGGDSQLAVKAGQAEICGTYSATRPPVAVYGLKSGSETDTALTDLKLTGVPGQGAFGPTATPAALADADAVNFASWTATKKDDTTIKATGFAPPSPIPAGSILKSATVKVTHRHSDDSRSDALQVTLTPQGGTPISASAAGRAGSPLFQTTTIPIDPARTGALAESIHKGTFTGATIDLKVSVDRPTVADIDAIQLDLTYVAPAFRAGAGCVTAAPYTGLGNASRCAMVTSDGSPNNQFYVQGTTYAPHAALDITLNNAAEQVFRFGVVSRSLWVKLTGSFFYSGPVIEVPDDSPGFVFSVYLSVYLCPSPGPCATSGTPSLRAKVAFVDADPVTPLPGRRQVSVLSWSNPR